MWENNDATTEMADVFAEAEQIAEVEEVAETTEVEEVEEITEEVVEPQEEEVKPTKQELDYEKSYKSLLPDYTKKAQELKRIQKELEESKKPQIQPQAQPVAPTLSDEEINDNLLELLTTNPSKALQMAADMGSKQALAQVQGIVNPLLQAQQAQQAAHLDAQLKSNFENVTKLYPNVGQDALQLFIDTAVDTAEKWGNENLIYDADFMSMVGASTLGNQVYTTAKQQGKEEALEELRAKQGLSASASKAGSVAEKSEDDKFFDGMMSKAGSKIWK